ncbi:MAG: hypothetical protein JSW06_01310 [Thermoplasmatales archaeon]|nr:MAG: hypothetical protein JSW06_01310 [Thermoplasmatales archaeon]
MIVIFILIYISKKLDDETKIIPTTIGDDEYKKAYELHLIADKSYNQRINFFLVAESMLVISYVTTRHHEIGEAISIIGLIFTSIWLYTNARSGERALYMIRNYLEGDPIYKDFIKSAGGLYSKSLLTYSIPISLNLLWIYFLCYSIGVNPWIWILESFLIMVIIGIWMNWWHIPNSK